jgi:hypothetical protein
MSHASARGLPIKGLLNEGIGQPLSMHNTGHFWLNPSSLLKFLGAVFQQAASGAENYK